MEHQSKVDKRMPRRIFEYCMGVMIALEKTQKVDDGSNHYVPIYVAAMDSSGVFSAPTKLFIDITIFLFF